VKDTRAAEAVAEWEYRERQLSQRPKFDRRNARRLTRELRKSGAALESVWVECLEHACGKLGIDGAALRRFVERSWTATMIGKTRWDRAAEEAWRHVELFKGVGKRKYDAWAAALAYNLCALNDGGWFAFASEPLAAWLGLERKAGSRVVDRLVKAGLIEENRDESGELIYSYKRGDSREVRWVGDWWFKGDGR